MEGLSPQQREWEARPEKWRAVSWAVKGFDSAHQGVWIVLVVGNH